MNEIMRNEIWDQPEALRQSLPSLRSQLSGLVSSITDFHRIIFTGSGDSYFAPLAMEYAARQYLTANIHVLSALEACRYWTFKQKDLLVAISISGEASRTLETARIASDAGTFVLAITANANSSLAKISHAAAIIPFRSRSRKTPHTTDYLTSLLAVAILIETLSKHQFDTLDNLLIDVTESLRTLEPTCSEIGQELIASEQFYFLGAGPSFATAQYAAAKFWEAGGIRAFAFQLEEFAHGPHLLVDAGDPVFLVSPGGQSLDQTLKIVEGLRQIGVKIFAITDKPEEFSNVQVLHIPSIDEIWSAFLTALPTQWLCWAVATAKGYDVVTKDGRHSNPDAYEMAHRHWVRD